MLKNSERTFVKYCCYLPREVLEIYIFYTTYIYICTAYLCLVHMSAKADLTNFFVKFLPLDRYGKADRQRDRAALIQGYEPANMQIQRKSAEIAETFRMQRQQPRLQRRQPETQRLLANLAETVIPESRDSELE